MTDRPAGEGTDGVDPADDPADAQGAESDERPDDGSPEAEERRDTDESREDAGTGTQSGTRDAAVPGDRQTGDTGAADPPGTAAEPPGSSATRGSHREGSGPDAANTGDEPSTRDDPADGPTDKQGSGDEQRPDDDRGAVDEHGSGAAGAADTVGPDPVRSDVPPVGDVASEPRGPESGVPADVRKYDRFQKIDGGTYDRANEFLRERTYITAREWAIARLCADFRTETGVEMTKIGENLPELVPFMTDTYTPQAVNQARASFEEKVRTAGATFLYGAMCDFFTAEELDDVMYEATEVAKFLLEVEGVELSVEEELEAEDRISEVMREVREHSAALRHDEIECPDCGHHFEATAADATAGSDATGTDDATGGD